MQRSDPSRVIVDWLLDEGRRIARTRELLAATGRKMNELGVPVWRCTIHTRQLHPELFSRTYLWTEDMDVAQMTPRHLGIQDTDFFMKSPIAPVYHGGQALRRRLTGPEAHLDFPVVAELRIAGATDYVVYPVIYSSGRQAAVTFATRRSDGFADADIAVIEGMLPALGVVLELRQVVLNAEALLDTYVGHDAGARILSGEIHRGVGETMRAILWMCDICQFTAMSEALPRDQLIALLNDFFDATAVPVYAHGGEVLKFMGDAMLAIFRLDDGADLVARGAETLRAAHEAMARVEAMNAQRGADGLNRIEYGLALHVGEVIYGNIGASSRLDFTIIGPAVNLVARLEKLREEVGCTLLLSADFVAQCPGEYVPLGQHVLRGVAQAQEVYTQEMP